LDSWRKCGVPEKDKKILDHLAAIRFLKEKGLKGFGIIGAYHARRVAPLMRHALPLYTMAPRASFDGMTLAEGAFSPFEVVQRIKEAMEPSWDSTGAPLDFVYPVPVHPPMRLESGYIILVSFPFLMPSLQLNSRPLDTDIEIGGPVEGPHPHGSLGSVAEGSVHEGGEPHQGQAIEDGEGGREEEEAVEIACAGAWGGH
jgi:hypothetical protein